MHSVRFSDLFANKISFMKILLTGGSGFIGAWIIKGFLDAGIDVCVLDLVDDRTTGRTIVGDAIDDIEWIVGDVSSFGALNAAARGCDQIVHLAALLTPACAADPHRGVEVNVNGTLNVFEAARKHGMRQVLYMSSASVYGPEHGDRPFPITLYGVWKLAMEGAARCYAEDHGIASAGFRPLVVYGPGRDVGLSAGPSIAIRKAAAGEPYTIPFSGSTDLVYVEDVVSAYVNAAKATLKGATTYTIVGETASMPTLVDEIKKYSTAATINVSGPELPVAAEIEESQLRTDFPSVSRTSLSEGVKKTWDWYSG